MATKKLVPRATNEGGLGTALKVWGPSWLQNLVITNLQTSTSASVLVETAGNVEKRAASTFVPNLESLDEGVSLTTTTESINYVGSGVTATVAGNDTTVTIPGNCVLDTEDSTTFVGLWDTKTGCQDPKTDGGLRYDALDNILKVGAESTNNRVWIRSNLINKFLGTLTVKSQNGTLMLWGNSGKVGVQGFGGAVIATFYSNLGLRLHHLNTESAPVHILTEGVATGATTTPFSVPSSGFITKTPITSLVPNLQSLDEGVSLTTTTQSFDFVGAGVTATVGSSNDVTVTIPGTSSVLDTEHAACFVGLYEAATGNLLPKTDEGLTYNALTGSELLSIGGDILLGDGTHNDMAIIDVKVGNAGINGNKLRLQGGDSGAGTNLNSGNVEILTGTGTGTGLNPLIIFTGAKKVASGTGVQGGQTIAYLQHSGDGGAASYNVLGIPSPVSGNDIFDISTYSDGATTIKTIHGSGASASAHLVLDSDGDISFKKTGTTLATVESLRTESFMMACSDETTALTTGTGKVTFRMPYAFTVTDIRASLTTAGTGANLVTVDVNNGGSTILTNKVTLDATEKTSTTAATAFSFTSAAAALLADDAEISIDIDQIDSGGVSAGLKVSIIGHKTV